ncbi:MAG: DUF429 domain-containing protein [Planctomycetota bacterium]
MLTLERVVGVDFSGAAKAGRNAWIASANVEGARLIVDQVEPLESLAGTPDRAPALAALVDAIQASDRTLWAMDFPFGLPIELGLGGWTRQLAYLAEWSGDARDFGRHCVDIAAKRVGTMHTRRVTDVETKTPFDCYHYRIIYQTFHGMRDVLRPLTKDRATAILPFQHRRAASARRLVVEACPSSTLKRLGLPHQRYKQPTAKLVDAAHRLVRETILKGLSRSVKLKPRVRKTLLDNPGGDALDAVIAAVGGWHGWRTLGTGHEGAGGRYPREGRVYA